MTSLSVPLRYPLSLLDVRRAINRTAIAMAAMGRHKLTDEYGREFLEGELRRLLCEGGLNIAIKAVEAADKEDEFADAALRDVGAELQTHLVQGARDEWPPGYLQIIAYFQRAAQCGDATGGGFAERGAVEIRGRASRLRGSQGRGRR